MDNISHSIAGLAVGELTHRILPEEIRTDRQRQRRRLLLLAGFLAGNFPDLDQVLSPLLPAPLGYLLHHRGYTHTLLGLIPQALIIWAGIWLLWPAARRLLRESATARRGFLLAMAGSFVVHLAMDWLNSYGVHPFYPFDSKWYYGDLTFIIEPVFWVALGVPLILTINRLWLKVALLLALAGGLALFALKGFLAWWSLGSLVLVAAALVWAQRSAAGTRLALLLGFAVSAGFVGVQHVTSRQAHDMAVADAKQRDAKGSVLDVALTAFPSNPACWSFVSLESDETSNTYTIRRGQISVMPSVLPLSCCPAGFMEPARSASASIAITAEEKGDIEKLRRLRAEDCHFDAWLRFARIPFVSDSKVSDLRYSSSRLGNFTTMDLGQLSHQACSSGVPQWDYPRADLLQGTGNR